MQEECQPCRAGTAQPQQGTTVCVACDRGKFQYFTGKSVCDDCARGTFAANPGTGECTRCETGTFNNDTGRSACTDCEPGTYQNLEGMFDCLPCEVGKSANGFGFDQCGNCPSGRAAPNPRTSECLLCSVPPGDGTKDSPETSADGATCICHVGYVLKVTRNEATRETTEFLCEDCPRGSNCRRIDGVSWDTIEALPGFWRNDTNARTFQRCLLPSHCQGGRNSTCQEFRTGPLCALCFPGYVAGSAGGEKLR